MYSLLFAFFIFIILTINITKKKTIPYIVIEPVLTPPRRVELDYGITAKCKEFAHSHADIGTVYPIEVYSPTYYIIPYQKASLKFQNLLAEKLKELNKDISREYILENWKGSNVMYIMITCSDICIGAIAVDRHNFEPFISHLYVDESFRKMGYGKRLLEHALEYSKAFKFKEVGLWCAEDLLHYYLKLGWEKGKFLKEEGFYIMKKKT